MDSESSLLRVSIGRLPAVGLISATLAIAEGYLDSFPSSELRISYKSRDVVIFGLDGGSLESGLVLYKCMHFTLHRARTPSHASIAFHVRQFQSGISDSGYVASSTSNPRSLKSRGTSRSGMKLVIS